MERQTSMLSRKTGLITWFGLRKWARTGGAIALFIFSLVLSLDFIQAETAKVGSARKAEVKTYRNPLLPDLNAADPHVIRVRREILSLPNLPRARLRCLRFRQSRGLGK